MNTFGYQPVKQCKLQSRVYKHGIYNGNDLCPPFFWINTLFPPLGPKNIYMYLEAKLTMDRCWNSALESLPYLRICGTGILGIVTSSNNCNGIRVEGRKRVFKSKMDFDVPFMGEALEGLAEVAGEDWRTSQIGGWLTGRQTDTHTEMQRALCEEFETWAPRQAAKDLANGMSRSIAFYRSNPELCPYPMVGNEDLLAGGVYRAMDICCIAWTLPIGGQMGQKRTVRQGMA